MQIQRRNESERLMLMKKILRSVLCAACVLTLVFSLTSCGEQFTPIEAGDAQLNPDKLMRGEQIAHLVYNTYLSSGDSSEISYASNYTLTREKLNDQDIIRIVNVAANGSQTMKTESVLLAQQTDNATSMMPLTVELTYEDASKMTDNIYAKAVHDHLVRSQTVTTKQYENESSSELKENSYVVNTAEQYFDSESLAFVLSTLPLSVGYEINMMLSSCNRDKVQSMNVSVMEERELETEAGTFICYVVCVRPNTIFANYASYMYYARDYDNMLVKIAQPDTSLELKSFSYGEQQPEA